MHFKPEALDTDIPLLFRHFKEIAGWSSMKKRFDWLDSELNRTAAMPLLLE